MMTITKCFLRKATGALALFAAMLLLPSHQAVAQSSFGRLTLQQGSPVITSDHVGARDLYLAPYGGKTVSVLSGGVWFDRQFTASPTDHVGLTLSLGGSASWPAGSIHDVFAVYDEGAVKLATRQWDAAMFAADVQISNVAPITTGTGGNAWLRASAAFDGNLAQGWNSGARIFPSNPDAGSPSFPANCIGQDWGAGNEQVVSKFVLTGPNDNNLQGKGSSSLKIVAIASNDNTNWTRLGFYYIDVSMVAGSYPIPINEGNRLPYRYAAVCVTGEAPSPGYSVNIAELQFFKRVEGIRRLACYDGVQVNEDAIVGARISASTTIDVAQYEATYLGTFAVDDSSPGQITAHVSFGPNRLFNLWNEYHRQPITLQAGVVSPGISNYALTSQRWQIVQPGFSLKVLQGRAVDRPRTQLTRSLFINAGAGFKAYEAGIAIDNTVAFSGPQIAANFDNAGPQAGSGQSIEYDMLPFAGIKEILAIERTNGGPGSVSPSVDFRSTALTARWGG